MFSSLTLNGVPPQTVAVFTDKQQQEIIDHFSNDHEVSLTLPIEPTKAHPCLEPFVLLTRNIINGFSAWGTTPVDEKCFIYSSYLKTGERTVPSTNFLHCDKPYGLQIMKEEGTITLRFLYATSLQPTFVDLTKDDHTANTLINYEPPLAGFLFKSSLLDEMKSIGHTMTGKQGDVVFFDGGTPHIAHAAEHPHQRVLVLAFCTLKLPNDWCTRVSEGDVPQWKLG